MARTALLLLVALCATRALAAADAVEPAADDGPQLAARTSRRELKAFYPSGGKGSWTSGHPTPFVAIHATVMKGGELVLWTPWVKSYSSAVYYPWSKSYTKLLGNQGIHGGELGGWCARELPAT
jgi:hypothetical protein